MHRRFRSILIPFSDGGFDTTSIHGRCAPAIYRLPINQRSSLHSTRRCEASGPRGHVGFGSRRFPQHPFI